jgi:hypothetical protein
LSDHVILQVFRDPVPVIQQSEALLFGPGLGELDHVAVLGGERALAGFAAGGEHPR